MALKANLFRKVFHFRFDARTSRGVMKERVCWFIRLYDEGHPEVFGLGECAPLPGLSTEWGEGFEEELNRLIHDINQAGIPVAPPSLTGIHHLIKKHFPDVEKSSSVVFGLEAALLDLANGGERKLFHHSFLEGTAIPINGLIWMGGMDFMLQQIEIKIRDGLKCIKIKVGGLDFERECDILQYVRRKYFRDKITVRLDANGAFKPDDVLYKLKELSKFNIHSIEQPLKPGSEYLPELCQKTPIPIALDEELIRVSGTEGKGELLDRIKPQFIILKPTLHGGLFSCQEWIEQASRRQMGWWITSALESNIGLNVLAQFAGSYPLEMPHGLGTGNLYDDNFQSPLEILNDGSLAFNPGEKWDLSFFD